ncbi:unnamed protein product, partial [Darwinula stevensoni]
MRCVWRNFERSREGVQDWTRRFPELFRIRCRGRWKPNPQSVHAHDFSNKRCRDCRKSIVQSVMPQASRDSEQLKCGYRVTFENIVRHVDADLSGIEKLSDLAAELTGETLTFSSPIPSPEMGFMDLEESRALHTLSDGFDSSFH